MREFDLDSWMSIGVLGRRQANLGTPAVDVGQLVAKCAGPEARNDDGGLNAVFGNIDGGGPHGLAHVDAGNRRWHLNGRIA